MIDHFLDIDMINNAGACIRNTAANAPLIRKKCNGNGIEGIECVETRSRDLSAVSYSEVRLDVLDKALEEGMTQKQRSSFENQAQQILSNYHEKHALMALGGIK